MNELLRIGVLHYHFKRAGVRSVIVNALTGLIRYGGYEAMEIHLISSDARGEGGSELAGVLADAARHSGACKVQVIQTEIAGLGYQDGAAVDRGTFLERAGVLSKQILESLNLERSSLSDPFIFHVHNPNLGKNPFLTMALKQIVEQADRESLPLLTVYQVHDFAEDNRPACWRALRDCTGQADSEFAVSMMYPQSRTGRLVWGCINSRDRGRLFSIGLDPDLVHLIPNSIPIETFTSPGLPAMSAAQLREVGLGPGDYEADLKKRIAEFAGREGFCFDADRRILLCPVKTIRRKNVIESILLMLCLNGRAGSDSYQLLITLGANSPEDVAYCRAIEEFVKTHKLPVVIGFGGEILRGGHHREIEDGKVVSYSLIDLLAASEAVVTTSIQEGFGYVFHEPWLAGKVLWGRNIAGLTCDFTGQGMKLDHLYDQLLIPFEWIENEWDDICCLYVQKMQSLYQAIEREAPSESELHRQVQASKMKQVADGPGEPGRMIDWADLPAETQLVVIKRIMGDKRFFSEVRPVDRGLRAISNWSAPRDSGILKRNKEVVAAVYNLRSRSKSLAWLFDKGKSLMNRQVPWPIRLVSNKAVFDQVLNGEQIRLLI